MSLVIAFSLVMVACFGTMLVYIWINYDELRDTQALKLMQHLNRRGSPETQ